jgi:hypothetical protein
MFDFQSELLGTWVSVDEQNRLGKSVVISDDSIKFENDYITLNNYYTIDSISDLDHFWISVDDKESKLKSKYCLIQSSDFIYLTELKGKIGISDHFTDCFLYRKMDSNLERPNVSDIKEIEIFIDKNILLEENCEISYSDMTNFFYIAYEQNLMEQNSHQKIVFNKVKYTKTDLKADLRAFYHENYIIHYDNQEIPVISANNKYWNSKSNISEWVNHNKLQENAWIAIIGRYNPDRRDCNKLFGENIIGQIQNFELIKLSCFLERINR